jgi:hypothetical protein
MVTFAYDFTVAQKDIWIQILKVVIPEEIGVKVSLNGKYKQGFPFSEENIKEFFSHFNPPSDAKVTIETDHMRSDYPFRNCLPVYDSVLKSEGEISKEDVEEMEKISGVIASTEKKFKPEYDVSYNNEGPFRLKHPTMLLNMIHSRTPIEKFYYSPFTGAVIVYMKSGHRFTISRHRFINHIDVTFDVDDGLNDVGKELFPEALKRFKDFADDNSKFGLKEIFACNFF